MNSILDRFYSSVCSCLFFRSRSSIFRGDKCWNDAVQADHSGRGCVLVFLGHTGRPGRSLYSPGVFSEKAAGKDRVKCHPSSFAGHPVHPACSSLYTHIVFFFFLAFVIVEKRANRTVELGLARNHTARSFFFCQGMNVDLILLLFCTFLTILL